MTSSQIERFAALIDALPFCFLCVCPEGAKSTYNNTFNNEKRSLNIPIINHTSNLSNETSISSAKAYTRDCNFENTDHINRNKNDFQVGKTNSKGIDENINNRNNENGYACSELGYSDNHELSDENAIVKFFSCASSDSCSSFNNDYSHILLRNIPEDAVYNNRLPILQTVVNSDRSKQQEEKGFSTDSQTILCQSSSITENKKAKKNVKRRRKDILGKSDNKQQQECTKQHDITSDAAQHNLPQNFNMLGGSLPMNAMKNVCDGYVLVDNIAADESIDQIGENSMVNCDKGIKNLISSSYKRTNDFCNPNDTNFMRNHINLGEQCDNEKYVIRYTNQRASAETKRINALLARSLSEGKIVMNMENSNDNKFCGTDGMTSLESEEKAGQYIDSTLNISDDLIKKGSKRHQKGNVKVDNLASLVSNKQVFCQNYEINLNSSTEKLQSSTNTNEEFHNSFIIKQEDNEINHVNNNAIHLDRRLMPLMQNQAHSQMQSVISHTDIATSSPEIACNSNTTIPLNSAYAVYGLNSSTNFCSSASANQRISGYVSTSSSTESLMKQQCSNSDEKSKNAFSEKSKTEKEKRNEFPYFYMTELRRLREEQPNRPLSEIAKHIQQKWKQMSAADKAYHNVARELDVLRYKSQIEDFMLDRKASKLVENNIKDTTLSKDVLITNNSICRIRSETGQQLVLFPVDIEGLGERLVAVDEVELILSVLSELKSTNNNFDIYELNKTKYEVVQKEEELNWLKAMMSSQGEELSNAVRQVALKNDEINRLRKQITAMEIEMQKLIQNMRHLLMQSYDKNNCISQDFLDKKNEYINRLLEIQDILGDSFSKIVESLTSCSTPGQLSAWSVVFDSVNNENDSLLAAELIGTLNANSSYLASQNCCANNNSNLYSLLDKHSPQSPTMDNSTTINGVDIKSSSSEIQSLVNDINLSNTINPPPLPAASVELFPLNKD